MAIKSVQAIVNGVTTTLTYDRSYEKHLYHEERIKRIPKSEAVQKVQTGGFGV